MSGDLWPPARKAELTRLLGEGFSFKAIADKMGLTKGQVAGQAHRLRKGSQKKPPLKPRANLRPVPDAGAGCRFIAGEPNWTRRGDAIFCRAPVQAGSSLCPDHHARCYFKPLPKPKLEAVA